MRARTASCHQPSLLKQYVLVSTPSQEHLTCFALDSFRLRCTHRPLTDDGRDEARLVHLTTTMIEYLRQSINSVVTMPHAIAVSTSLTQRASISRHDLKSPLARSREPRLMSSLTGTEAVLFSASRRSSVFLLVCDPGGR